MVARSKVIKLNPVTQKAHKELLQLEGQVQGNWELEIEVGLRLFLTFNIFEKKLIPFNL